MEQLSTRSKESEGVTWQGWRRLKGILMRWGHTVVSCYLAQSRSLSALLATDLGRNKERAWLGRAGLENRYRALSAGQAR